MSEHAAITPHPDTKAFEAPGWALLEQKKYDAAITSFDRLFTLQADNIAAFDGVLKVHPRDQNVLLWKIALLRNLRRFDASAEKLAPRSLRLNNERGWLHFHQLQQDQALAIFERVLQQDPHDVAALQGKIAAGFILNKRAMARPNQTSATC